jgi:hypothetical protein
MDDFDRALLKVDRENEPAERHRKDLERRATFLLGELRANRRLLEEAEFSDLPLLDEKPEVFLLDLQHWGSWKVLEVLEALPQLRPLLIELDQAGVFQEEYALENALYYFDSDSDFDEWT